MGDVRPPISAALDVFGLAATVTVPGEASVSVTAFWLPPVAYSQEFHPNERKRILVLPLAALPELPSGTIVNVPEVAGGQASDWKVNEVDRVEFDHYRAVVVPAC
jgi:hypothetical protein